MEKSVVNNDLELVPVPGEEGVWVDTDRNAVNKRYLVDTAVERVTGIDVKTLALHREGSENSALRPKDRGLGRRPRYVYIEFVIREFAKAMHAVEGGAHDPSRFEGASLGDLLIEVQDENARLKADRSKWEARAEAYERVIELKTQIRELDQEVIQELQRARR